MKSQTAAPAIIHKLVETFEQNLDSYRSTKNETELRREFLDKFFTALGWDVANEKGYDEAGKEVVHEFSVEVAGQQKKADYAFRVGRGERFDFLVEAKKPSVRIETSQDAAFQIRRYGWSAKLPVNILTDFEHFAVYDCRTKPSYNEKASMGRILLMHYKEYVERWNEIAEIFSLEAVRKGSFAKYAEGTKGKKGTADVDDAFLQEIERWRELLAKNIALRNPDIDVPGLNYAVQMIIDRIVFLRICEERGIEPENQLLEIATPPPPSPPLSLRDTSPKFDGASVEVGGGREGGVYRELCALFQRADTKYNSGLFHFKAEKGQPSRPDDLTLNLDIDDKVLRDIVSNLYYPKSPYAFLYIPSDILGQVYERFLGKVIRLTAGHQAKVEEKPEVRKAGGVYYTPTFIVGYIVSNTLGRLLRGLTPKEAARLKILDPACGSGTFLLGAYQFLLDWHLNWYLANDPEKWAQRNPSPIFALQKMGEAGRGWQLTTEKKKEILLNNIYGVDLDPQAVEVTKLSLLLKVLENASGQLGLGLERVLPDLGNNIKCGNSLIGFDYFEGQLLVDDEERARVNPFDWKREFPEVFDPHRHSVTPPPNSTLRNLGEAGRGFDAVIGNPPYLFITELGQSEKDYYFKKYKTTEYRFDVYGLFIELSVQGLLREKGLLSFIIPHTLLSNDSFAKLRKLLLETTFVDLVTDIGPGVFETARNETMIFVVRKGNPLENESTKVIVTNSKGFPAPIKEFNVEQSKWNENKNASWLVNVSSKEMFLVSRLELAKYRLGALCTINQGLRTGDNEKYLGNKRLGSLWKPAAGGKHVGRYELLQEEIYVYYDPKVLDAPRKPEIFSSPEKIVVQEIRNITLARRIIATYDTQQYYCLQSTNVINLRPDCSEISMKYLLGILNSNCANYFFKQKFSGNNHIASNQLAQIPVPFAEKAQHDKMVSLVEEMLSSHKTLAAAQSPQEKERLERQIHVTDRAIDRLVYELYGLTEEEIKIVEQR